MDWLNIKNIIFVIFVFYIVAYVCFKIYIHYFPLEFGMNGCDIIDADTGKPAC